MWVNITVGKVDPANYPKALAILDRDEVRSAFRAVKGFKHDFLITSLDTPGLMQSITMWEDAELAQAFFASPAYLNIIKDLGPLFVERPQRNSYELQLEF